MIPQYVQAMREVPASGSLGPPQAIHEKDLWVMGPL